MLALDYGSDSENEDVSPTDAATSASSSVAELASGKTSLSLPPPTAGTSSSAQGKRTKKIAIAIPELPKPSADDAVEEPPAKKPRFTKGTGAGVSALLSMLPAPKKVADAPPPPRVLGGGKGKALQFSAPPIETADDTSHEDEATSAVPSSSLPFRPASLVKGRKNVNVEDGTSRPSISKPAEPAVDFFSLGSPSNIPFARVLKLHVPDSASSSSRKSAIPSVKSFGSVSSAPKVEVFVPPEPTQQDEYPGYYKLPSGDWAAYDTSYYKKYYDKWKKEYDSHVRALEKGTRGFEDYDQDRAAEVNAAAEMERAKVEVKEREERKALTTGEAGADAAKPNMNVQVGFVDTRLCSVALTTIRARNLVVWHDLAIS
jgi:proline-rich protein PRCC